MTKKYSKSTFTTGQLARILEVTDETIRNWIKKGIISVIKLPSGRNQIPLDIVEKLMRQYNIPEDRLYNSPRLKILLADTDDAQRLLFKKYFEGKQEYLVAKVKNSIELGITLVKFKPDVLLLDIGFSTNLNDLIDTVKKEGDFEGISIGLMPFDKKDEKAKKELNVNDWLEKPYTFENLRDCIEDTLKKS